MYDFWFSGLKRVADSCQKKLVSLGPTPFCFTLFSVLLSFCFSSLIPCPVCGPHSAITSVKERVEGVYRGKRKAGSGKGIVRSPALMNWRPQSLLFNWIHRHWHLLLWNFLMFFPLDALCMAWAYVGEMFPSPSRIPSFCSCSLPHSWNISVLTIPFYRWENRAWGSIKLSKFIQQFNGRARIRIQEPWVPHPWLCWWLLFVRFTLKTKTQPN